MLGDIFGDTRHGRVHWSRNWTRARGMAWVRLLCALMQFDLRACQLGRSDRQGPGPSGDAMSDVARPSNLLKLNTSKASQTLLKNPLQRMYKMRASGPSSQDTICWVFILSTLLLAVPLHASYVRDIR